MAPGGTDVAKRRPEPQVGEIVDLTHDGRGVTALGGKRVFVHDALAGEVVNYQIVKRRRNYDEAVVLDVASRAAERVEPRCPVFGVCGGCTLQHLEHEAQLAHKQRVLIENLRRIGELSEIPLSKPIRGPVWQYRRRARLGVKQVFGKGRVLVGFRERSKPYIADMQACAVLEPALERLPHELATLIDTMDAKARLPQVEVTAADRTTALVFRILDPLTDADRDRLVAFQQAHGYDVWLQTGGPDTLAPLAAIDERLDSPQPLDYRLDAFDLTLAFQPNDFIQINRQINDRLVVEAIDALQIAPTHRVLDLFCGIGNFTLPIATRAAHVVGVEGAAALTDRARDNARDNSLENVEFVTADLETVDGTEAWLQTPFDRVLLDPARAGAGAMMPLLGKIQPGRIVYVSCHPGTLARDLGALVANFGYRLTDIRIADMFPHTAHVETLAVLERTR